MKRLTKRMPKCEGLLSSTEAHERLADIEDILGDYYDLDYLRYLVSADVVEVVRCKDCENAYVPDVLKDWLGENKYCQEKKKAVPFDGYCHLGIRKEKKNHEKISD